MKTKTISELLLEDMAYYDTNVNEMKFRLFVSQLEKIDPAKIERAMNFFRSQPGRRQMPMPADLIQFAEPTSLGDGHPGVEEAWAMIPKDEETSVFWTPEMAEAYGAVRNLLDEDPIAARMAFKEAYPRVLAVSRSKGLPVKWIPSFGHEIAGRESAVREAIHSKKISHVEALEIFPTLDDKRPKQARIEAPVEESGAGFASIADVIKKITRGENGT